MIQMTRWLSILFLFITLIEVSSQSTVSDDANTLRGLLHRLDSSVSSEEKFHVSDSIEIYMEAMLKQNPTYTPALERIGKISSADGLVHVYTWNYQDEDLRYRYGGLVQYKSKYDNKIQYSYTALIDQTNKIKETGFVRPNEWYGALYYEIIVRVYKKTRYYTVLGWDGNDGVIGRKIIDNFAFDKKGRLKFGYPLFRFENKVRSRVVYSFSGKGSMMLAYDASYKRIVCDNLSPDIRSHEGLYQYYGPDFTYNGFRFKKGKWWYEKNIDVRNKQR